MRIASLVPSATELLFAMGLGDDVVAVTHECDYPFEATDLPQLTTSVIPANLPPGEVDALVRGQVGDGRSLYTLDEELLKEEEPDLIVAQQLCDVCAVSIDDVRAVAERMESKPKVISLDPTTIGEMLGAIRKIAEATDEKDLGVDLVQTLADRIDDVKIALKDVGRPDGPERVSVAALEWLDPVFLGGHWVPQMIELAGGMDFLGLPGEPSREADWDEVRIAEPSTVILMQCGYDAARAAEEAYDFTEQLRGLGAANIYATDANAYFSRPGPRLIDGIELLAHTLHPTLVPEPATGAMIELDF
ncbi:MAG: ABC transporter substrate-binding protein [Solirubrobacterales bacterium]|nr:ABC transporter substrate-binding protein [Solirubrobacterales bacterium]